MARYGRQHQIVMVASILQMKAEMQRDMFDGSWEPTRIKRPSLSGQIDPITEEITYFQPHSWVNVSGIVLSVKEGDELLGQGGRVKVGDSSVLYPYDAVSGLFLQNLIQEIHLPNHASGLYRVVDQRMTTVAGYPVFIKFALTLVRSDG
jgi:hypothetical protein